MFRPLKDNPKVKRRGWLFNMTGGKCFYCGLPTYNHGFPSPRDWLFLSSTSQTVREHRNPTIRGGGNDKANLVPSCRGCNNRKGAFNVDEFRFVTALQAGSLNFRFVFDLPAPVQRDWLLCHSASAARALIIHNIPSAAEAYILRNGWARGPQAEHR